MSLKCGENNSTMVGVGQMLRDWCVNSSGDRLRDLELQKVYFSLIFIALNKGDLCCVQ